MGHCRIYIRSGYDIFGIGSSKKAFVYWQTMTGRLLAPKKVDLTKSRMRTAPQNNVYRRGGPSWKQSLERIQISKKFSFKKSGFVKYF